MQLFWCPRTRADRALWLLEETGLDYERVLVDIRDANAPRPAEFALASPMGKVPALADGEVRLADSAAIGLYLADRYPQCGLAPGLDDPRRGDYLYWMLYTPGVIEPAMMEKFAGLAPNRVSAGWGDFETMIDTLAKGLAAGPWILGEQFTAADVMLGSSVHFMQAFDVLPVVPALHEYLQRCMARPAFRRAMPSEPPAAG